MNRYFFDVVDGYDHQDASGSTWPNLEAVRIEAVRLSGEILSDMPDRFWRSKKWTMTVSDENRVPLFTLKFVVSRDLVD